jgi:hypothetical protein
MMALAGNVVPGRARPGCTGPDWALGIVAVTGGTFLGAGTRLGLFRLARAILKFFTGVDAGRRCPWTKAGGIICLR